MRMSGAQARVRFAAAPVARLATADAAGVPHLVPIVFALVADSLYFVIDEKPKSTTELRRLVDIRANPRVSVLVDRYDDDWDKLWWARADGSARVLDRFDEPAMAARSDGRDRGGPLVGLERVGLSQGVPCGEIAKTIERAGRPAYARRHDLP
jgi:PPOX class probable F420-dependent enzyme